MVGRAQRETVDPAFDREDGSAVVVEREFRPFVVSEAEFHLRREVEFVPDQHGHLRLHAGGQEGFARIDAQAGEFRRGRIVVYRVGDDLGILALLVLRLEFDRAVFRDVNAVFVVELKPAFVVAVDPAASGLDCLLDAIPDGRGVLIDLGLDVDRILGPFALQQFPAVGGGDDIRDRRFCALHGEHELVVYVVVHAVDQVVLDLQDAPAVTDGDGTGEFSAAHHLQRAVFVILSVARENVGANRLVFVHVDEFVLRAVEVREIVDQRSFKAIGMLGQVERHGEGFRIGDGVVLFDPLIISVSFARIRAGHHDRDVFITRGRGHDRTADLQRSVQHYAVGIHEKHRRGVDLGVGERRRSHARFLGGPLV